MTKLLSLETIQKIKDLRKMGYSMPEIKREVKAGYGSIFRYIKGVEILPEYRKIWHSKRGGSLKRKILLEEASKIKAQTTIKTLVDKERLLFLAALYWAEGTKSDFSLSNTDPELIRVYVDGLQKIFNVPKQELRATIRIYEDMDQKMSLDFWSKIIGIPTDQFVSVNILKGKKTGKLKYGMCRVRVIKGGYLLKYLLALKNQVKKLF